MLERRGCAKLPPWDIQLLAQGRCKNPPMYGLHSVYFGKGRRRSCDWSWGLKVWAAGSCLSDSDPLRDLGKPESLHTTSPLLTSLGSLRDDGNRVEGGDGDMRQHPWAGEPHWDAASAHAPGMGWE